MFKIVPLGKCDGSQNLLRHLLLLRFLLGRCLVFRWLSMCLICCGGVLLSGCVSQPEVQAVKVEEETNPEFPKDVPALHIRNLLTDNLPKYADHGSLNVAYGKLFAEVIQGDEHTQLTTPMVVSLSKDKEFSHWVFFAGVLDLHDFLRLAGTSMVASDKEANVKARLKVLMYLSGTLDKMYEVDDYREFLQDTYVDVSNRLLGRKLLKRKR